MSAPEDDLSPLTFDGTDREREAARRELAKMPPDLLREVHAIAARRDVSALDAMAFLIHDAPVSSSGPQPRLEQWEGGWRVHCPHCPWNSRTLPFPDPDAALHGLTLHAVLCTGSPH